MTNEELTNPANLANAVDYLIRNADLERLDDHRNWTLDDGRQGAIWDNGNENTPEEITVDEA